MTDGTEILAIFDQHTKGGRFESSQDVREFREAAIAHYDNWAPPPAADGTIRLSVDMRAFRGYYTLPAAAALLSDTQIEIWDEQESGGAGAYKLMRRGALGAFLYGDQYVDGDPLSFEKYFRPAGEFDDFDEHRVLDAARYLKIMRPLIEQGIFVPAPIVDMPISLDEEDEAEEQELSDYVESTSSRDGGRLRVANSMDRWYLKSAVALAEQAGATLVPQFRHDWQYLSFLKRHQPPVPEDSGRVVGGLMTSDLPLLTAIDAKTLIKVHQNEGAFADWKVALREASRTIRAECTEARFETQAREVFHDFLSVREAEVDRAVRKSNVLRQLLSEQPLQLTFGAAYGFAAGYVTGLPLAAAAVTSVASAVATGAAGVSSGVLQPPAFSGATAIVSMLRD